MSAVIAILSNRYVQFAIALAVAITWSGLKGYDLGRDWAVARYEKAAAEERKRQAEANAEAQRALAAAHLQYLQAQSALEDIMETNSREAQSDPGAATGGIGTDSVRRLNRIR